MKNVLKPYIYYHYYVCFLINFFLIMNMHGRLQDWGKDREKENKSSQSEEKNIKTSKSSYCLRLRNRLVIFKQCTWFMPSQHISWEQTRESLRFSKVKLIFANLFFFYSYIGLHGLQLNEEPLLRSRSSIAGAEFY